MKNLIVISIVILVCLVTTSCEESGTVPFELPFGGRIQHVQNDGIVQSDFTSSLWFFENGCVYLVDDCDSFNIGSVEVHDGQISFFHHSEWISGDHCPSSKDLVEVLQNLSGVYSISESGLLTITTHAGDAISIERSNVIIDPLCLVESHIER